MGLVGWLSMVSSLVLLFCLVVTDYYDQRPVAKAKNLTLYKTVDGIILCAVATILVALIINLTNIAVDSL